MHMYLFYFINWDGWRCWWTDFVPEAIHNPVAIKAAISDLMVKIIDLAQKLHWVTMCDVFSTIWKYSGHWQSIKC